MNMLLRYWALLVEWRHWNSIFVFHRCSSHQFPWVRSVRWTNLFTRLRLLASMEPRYRDGSRLRKAGHAKWKSDRGAWCLDRKLFYHRSNLTEMFATQTPISAVRISRKTKNLSYDEHKYSGWKITHISIWKLAVASTRHVFNGGIIAGQSVQTGTDGDRRQVE